MNILKRLQWVAAHLSWLTMVFSPVALGAEAEKLSKQQLAQMIQEFGLNKKSTVGEFWQKSKAYYPPHIYQELEQFVKLNKNLEMPAFEISSAKATDGSEIPVLQSTQNGKTNRMQFFANSDKWVKFNNQVLSEADLVNPDAIFKRLMANDIKVKKEYDALAKKAQGVTGKSGANMMSKESLQQMQDFTRFKGFPTITPMMWTAMTMEQRAGYVVKMRLMLMTAQKVLAYDNAKPTSKNILELMFANDAYAQDAKPAVAVRAASAANPHRKGRVSKNRAGKIIKISDSANTCIVAGYVGAEGIGDNSKGKNRRLCSLDIALGMYEARGEPAYVRDVNNDCMQSKGSSWRACNPMQYSFPQGKPICIDQNDVSFQTATHREGECDKASPLSSSQMIMEFNGKDYSNVQPASVRQKMIEEDQRKTDFAATKDFIAGMLAYGEKNRNSKLLAMFKDGKWDAELDREMVSMQQTYEEEVNRAIKSCHENVALKQSDSQQKGACDQLHRRWLFTEKFVAEFRAKACPDGSAYIGSYGKFEIMTNSNVVVAKDDEGHDVTKSSLNKSQLKDSEGKGLCKCESDGKSTSFKGSCAVPAVIIPPVPTAPAEEVEKPLQISCPSGTEPVSGDGGNECRCDGKDGNLVPITTAPGDVERLCKKSDLWKWLLGGLGILAVLAIFSKKKKSKNPQPPAIIRENTVSPPNTPVVPPANPPNVPVTVVLPPASCAPKVGTYPACVCPTSNTCTPGQQIYNTETCQCTNVPEVPTPPQPPPSLPSEGGAGNNCPNGNCNGGVPQKTTN